MTHADMSSDQNDRPRRGQRSRHAGAGRVTYTPFQHPDPEASMTQTSPEIGRSIVASGIRTNYHDIDQGFP